MGQDDVALRAPHGQALGRGQGGSGVHMQNVELNTPGQSTV